MPWGLWAFSKWSIRVWTRNPFNGCLIWSVPPYPLIDTCTYHSIRHDSDLTDAQARELFKQPQDVKESFPADAIGSGYYKPHEQALGIYKRDNKESASSSSPSLYFRTPTFVHRSSALVSFLVVIISSDPQSFPVRPSNSTQSTVPAPTFPPGLGRQSPPRNVLSPMSRDESIPSRALCPSSQYARGTLSCCSFVWVEHCHFDDPLSTHTREHAR